MLIIRQIRIYRLDIRANPNILYIFGDNLDREGFGGQAREMRGELNSYGIATKRSPSHNYPNDYFFDTEPDAIEILEHEFDVLEEHAINMKYQAIVIPLDGIGTGLSRLQETAPKLLAHINKRLKELEKL